jgi:hypothetical protein
MGWTCLNKKPASVKDYLDKDWTQGSLLKSQIVAGEEYYAAVKMPDGKIICAVVLLESHGVQFCTKHLDEYSGPYAVRCPKSILDLLSPLDSSVPGYEYARDWREQCKKEAERLSCLKTIQPGTKIQYGGNSYTIKARSKNSWIVQSAEGQEYKMSPAQLKNAQL